MIGIAVTLLYDEARRIWCYRWLVITTAAVIFCACALYILALPNVYDAWAQVFVNKETPLAAAAQGVSLVGNNYGSPLVVQKTLLNDQNLEAVVKQLDTPGKAISKKAMAGAVATLKSRIHITTDDDDGFIGFDYTDHNPVRARDVVQLLVNRFISANEDRNLGDLDSASHFLDQQVASYNAMLADSAAKMADFHRQHPGFAAAPPAPTADASTDDDVTVAAAPATQTAATPAPPKPTATAEKVAALQTELSNLHQQYTDQYPDVIAVQRQLNTAMADNARETTLAATTTPVAVASPAPAVRYVRQHHLRRRAIAAPSPEIEAQWADLQRSDEALRISYQQLVARQQATKMSQAVYSADGSGKYQVTRAAQVPLSPTGPNRKLYLALAFLVSGGAGLAVGYLRAAVNGIFVSPRELEDAFGLPVVGTLSWEPAWDTSAAKRSRPSMAMVTGAGVVVAIGLALLLFTARHGVS